ncbi:MAG TPA: nucleotidyltransferase family protein, partial [Candidatus Dormibacteraeota bacterium]|nr:nucleotidyltransferase family protein [Candidatus Dormibacteraeota bacterium]
EWARAHAGDADWRWVRRTAAAHKLAALVASRVDAAGIAATLDGDSRQQLATARADAARRAGMAEHTIATLADAGATTRLPFFVVKGSVLSHLVYRDPHLRRFADVDVVVRHADVPRAEALLSDLGYRPGGVEGLLAAKPTGEAERAFAVALTRRFDTRHLAAHTWYAPGDSGRLSIDLHWHVAPARLRVDEAQLWAHTVPVEIGATTVLTLSPAATILHLAAHATTCLLNGFRLLHLVDVGWAATRFSAQAADTWQLAEQWRVAPHLAQVLAMGQRLLEIDLPLAAAGPRHTRRFAELATAEPFLLDAATLASRSAPDRLWRELAWGIAMGCLRRNVGVVCGASWARARFRWFRRQQHGA